MASIGRMVPGVSSACLEHEHLARYQFACEFARDCAVLDVACGMGYAAPLFVQAGAAKYVGVDLDEETVNAAAECYGGGDRIRFHVDNACELRRVAADSFDLVVSFETIEHVSSPEAFLLNVRRVLRRNGTFIVSTPNRLRYSPGNDLLSKPWNPFHWREWNTNEFVELLKTDFRVVDVLGQLPIAGWKARVFDLAARHSSVNTVLEAVQRVRHGPPQMNPVPKMPPSSALAVQRVRRLRVPLYTVCVAKPL